MKDGYREKINIATKSPVWLVKKHEDFYEKLDEQISNLEVEQIDFYLLHALSVDSWKNIKKSDYKKFLESAKKEGKIRFAGFSFHDNVELFKEIVDDYEWDFCQIQLNYMDEDYQAGLEGLKYAHEKGLGVIVMEPLRGGLLAKLDMPQELADIWNSYDVKRAPAEWALKYVWNYEEVGLLLSGMSTMEQVVENVKTASEGFANSLTKEEINIIAKVRDFYNSRTVVDCTNCKYCMPCPTGVNIPDNFRAYNHESMYGDFEGSKMMITAWMDEGERASNCIQCGQCEGKCPQNIEIIKHLEIIADRYEQKNN